MPNPALRHIANNFGLYGFSSQETAVLQSAKELIENSIDACRQVTDCASYMQLNIVVSSDNHQHVLLEMVDNGCGIRNPLVLLQCFTTSKVSITPQVGKKTVHYTSGKFGVGLSVCALYSLTNTQEALW